MKYENLFSLDYQTLPTVNIGDYIQSIAAELYFGSAVTGYIERDKLKSSKKRGKLVMNCWYGEATASFPPSGDIDPLFVSFHLNSNVRESFLSDPINIEYLKYHEPIGCRDKDTADFMKRSGVEAYFSSCLTTTIGSNWRCQDEISELDKEIKSSGKVVIVDPVSTLPKRNLICKFKEVLRALNYGISHPLNCRKVYRSLTLNRPKDYQVKLLRSLYLGYNSLRSAYITSQLLPRVDFSDIEYYSHIFTKDDLPTRKDRIAYAKKLLEAYSSADLVISSRIHCCLPSLGFNTPTLYLQQINDPEESFCRKSGLLELLNVVNINVDMIEFDAKADIQTITNPKTYSNYAIQLHRRVTDFLSV